MTKKGYIPTKAELQAAIIDIAESRYGGIYAPGKSTWDNYKPIGWATSATLSRHFKVNPRDAPNWPATVKMLVGLAIAPPNLTVVKRHNASSDDKPIFERVDDSVFSEGIAFVRAYSKPTPRGTYEVHYILR